VRRCAYSPILDTQERPQMSQRQRTAFKSSCLPLFTLGFQCRGTTCFQLMDRGLAVQSDRSSISSSSSGGAMSQRFRLVFSCPHTAFAVHRENGAH